MSSSEWIEWRAFFELEPFGSAQEDFRAALICSTMANLHGQKKGGGSFTASDFIYRSSLGIDPAKQQEAEKNLRELQGELARIANLRSAQPAGSTGKE